MADARVKPGEDASAAGRCVLLIAPGEAPPQRLLAALGRRRVTVTVVCDGPRAMVEVVRHGARLLIVTDPDRVPAAAELVEAVRRASPRTVCWQYQQRSLTPINGRVGGVSLGAAKPDPAQVAADHDRLRDLAVHVEGQTPQPQPLVSADELAMLLGPVPDEASEG